MHFYIDPGTGSMLFTVLLGIIGAGIYSLRMAFIKLRYKLGGGKVERLGKKIPFVIFSDDKRYWNIFEPILRILSGYGKEILYITASEDDPALECALPNFKAEYLPGNKIYTRLNFLEANVVFSTTPGLDVYQWKRSKGVDRYVHIPHAASEIILYRMFGIDYYDAIMLSGEYQAKNIRDLEALRNLPEKDLVMVGIPYMDEMVNRLKSHEIINNDQKTVLLAPSWGSSAMFAVYGHRIIDELLKTDYHIIIRPHPQSFTSEADMINKLMEKYPESERLEWNRDRDNFDVLCRSDILISDFSGVVFDFSLVYDKPVIYTNPDFDLSLYDAWWLDDELWTVSALKRIGVELTEDKLSDIGNLIDDCLNQSQFADGREQVRAETWANYGTGAQKAAEYLIAQYKMTKSES